MNEWSQHLAHMGLGLAEEYLEYLDEQYPKDDEIIDVNILKKEMGDLCWYLAGLRYIFMNDKPIALFEFQGDAIDLSKEPLTLEVCLLRIQNKLKKYFAYGKDFNIDELRKDIEIAFHAIAVYECETWHIDFQDMLNSNIEKLKIRFPDNFTDGEAIAQADNQ